MMTATKFYRYLGGNATNVAVGLARLGIDAALISKVGVDIHAEYLLASLAAEKVDTSYIVSDASQPTAQCYMTRRADGFPDYHAWPSPNASKSITAEDVAQEAFQSSWIWHAAAVSFIAKPRRFAMSFAIDEAHAQNKIISFDAGFPLVESDGGAKAAWNAMAKADILKFNLAEAAYWSKSSIEEDLDVMVAKLLKRLSPAVLIVTLAEKGAVLYCSGEKAFCPPLKVNSIGDVGPGDAFSAGLIYGLSTLGDRGRKREELYEFKLKTWEGLARYGACTGALITRSHSATESFPRLTELMASMGKTSLEA